MLNDSTPRFARCESAKLHDQLRPPAQLPKTVLVYRLLRK